jgi:hypothetical protein
MINLLSVLCSHYQILQKFINKLEHFEHYYI